MMATERFLAAGRNRVLSLFTFTVHLSALDVINMVKDSLLYVLLLFVWKSALDVFGLFTNKEQENQSEQNR